MSEIKSYDEIVGVTEPTLERVGDVMVIGVTHAGDLSRQKIPPQPFTDIIRGSDHLIMEKIVKHKFYTDVLPVGPGYEDMAEAYFSGEKKENIHGLEDGVDKAALAMQYGIPLRSYLLSRIIIDLKYAHKYSDKPLEFWQTKINDGDILDKLKVQNPSMSQLNDEDLRNLNGLAVQYANAIFNPTARNPDSAMLQESEIGMSILNRYMAGVRDFEVFIPKLLSFTNDLKGRKSVVVGRLHHQNLVNALKGIPMKKPPSWGEYCRTQLSSHDMEDTRLFTNIAERGKLESSSSHPISRSRAMPPRSE